MLTTNSSKNINSLLKDVYRLLITYTMETIRRTVIE